MKTIITLSICLMAGLAFGQQKEKEITQKPVKHHLKPLMVRERKAAAPAEIAAALSPSKSIVGHYYVAKYSVLGLATPSPAVIDQLVGSEVVVSGNRISGSEVQFDPFDIVSKKLMSSSDYIYEVFGRTIRAPEPNLPQEVKVLETVGSDLYGIIQLPDNRLAVPYRGLLLILEQGR